MEEGETKICQNCKREIPVGNFTIHSVHCTRNVRLCPVCKEPVLLVEMDRHNEKQHKQLPCRQCSENVSASDMEDHIRDSCDFTIRSCRYCELELTRKDMTHHESYCGTRTEQCPDCREWVMLKYRQLHLDSNHGFLRLDDDPAPNNLPKRLNFGLNRPPGLFNIENNNRPVRNGLVRNINLLQDEMLPRLLSQVSDVSNLLSQGQDFVDRLSALSPSRGPVYSRSHTFDYAFSPDPQRQVKKNVNEEQAKTAAGMKDNKNTPSLRDTMKKRAAPKPPTGDASAPTSPTAAKSGGSGAETSPDEVVDFAGPSTSSAGPSTFSAGPSTFSAIPSTSSAGMSTTQPKPKEPLKKSPNISEKVKKVNNRVADDQQRKKSQAENAGHGAGPSNKLNHQQDQQPKAKVDNFKNFKPMTTEEFMNRVKKLQMGKDARESGGSNSVKEDRISNIKHSLKELRRELNEVTAPLNNNVNSNNNIIENDSDNGMGDMEALTLSSSEEDEGAAGGCSSHDEEEPGDVQLPCEFCGTPVLADDLVQHQTGCRPDLARYSPSQRRSSEPVIPCEFCTQSLPVYLISEHQERCGREAQLLFPD